MSMRQEFKDFIMRGNVIDMAVGVVVGGAFSAIVNSLVNDIIMPLIGYVTSGISFEHLRWVIKPATEADPAVTVNYGTFINTIINFLIIALCLFLVVKGINSFRKKDETKAEEAPAEPSEKELLQDILQELRQQN